jgi:ATP-dependent RNA helicase RhlE
MTKFSELNLNQSLITAIEKKGYQKPTPIQEQTIPHLMAGKDILGIAQTGTGKTAAFALPIINNLFKNKVRTAPKGVRALILAPTRELASQINTSIRDYSEGLEIFSGVVFGGVSKQGQVTMMKKGCDILVATPGRLLDLISEGCVKFDQLEVFVLDEADRMLDMGFIRDVKKIMTLLPKKRQTMLFSATMPQTITALASSLLKDPVRVEVTPESSTVEKIDQKINMVDKLNKLRLLKKILNSKSIKSALVFTRTKHAADRVVKELFKSGLEAVAIHGNKSQGARQKALKMFKDGKTRILIATDIAARGIDVDRVTHVINYNLPEDPESYVHRIGRTARAGREGVAISLCEAVEVKLLRNIEKFIKIKIPVESNHEFHVVHSAATINFEENYKKENHAKRLAERGAQRKSRAPKARPKSRRF